VDVSKLTPAARRCFDSLPEWLQENICQSGLQFTTEKELRDFAAKFRQA